MIDSTMADKRLKKGIKERNVYLNKQDNESSNRHT